MSLTLLHERALEVLDLLDHAVWITDPDSGQIIWANRSAVSLWSAQSRDDLVARPLNHSPTIRTTLKQLQDRVNSGERIKQERTIFPLGEAKRVAMTIGPYSFADGRTALLVEARPVHQMDSEMVRAAEAVRYAPIVVATFSIDGLMIQANTLARQTFGNTFTLASIFCEKREADDLANKTRNGETFSRDVRAFTNHGKRWFAIEAMKILDPVISGAAILVSAHDVTSRVDAEHAKDDLVSIVSHELRTPITAIKGAIELLAGGVANEDEALSQELLQMAAENSRRLSSLVDDLLDVRKMTSGNLSVDFRRCDLKQVLHATVALHNPAAQARNVRLVCSAENPLPVEADEGRIQQVLLNLVSNALKHTPPGGRVLVAGELRENRVRVSVTDDGPGVPESFRSRIFQRFSQADSSSTRTNSGTGLGLYIAKTLIELHRGELAFDDAEDGGAVFYFELPLLPPTNENQDN